MSRVGKKPVLLPAGVTFKQVGREITLTGPNGILTWAHPTNADVSYDAGSRMVVVGRKDDSKQGRANHGLTRALVANMVTGVSRGFERRLQIYGTGYNCKLVGGALHVNVGFSGRRRGIGSQFELPVPKGLEVVIEKDAARGDNEPAQLLVKGCDKQRVGQFAAEVRALRKTEPYKGKGIRYEGEHIKRKQGKALAGTGT
jgi:large subunit ribosomal protein L6